MIKTFVLRALGLIAASAMCSHPAYASTTSSSSMSLWPTNSLDLRLGAYFPGSSGAKFFGGETQLTAGLDYRLSATRGGSPGATDAYFDYMGGAKNSGYVHSGGIGLDVRGMTGPAFYGVGLGLYNTSVRFNNGTFGNQTGPGGKLFAGMDLGRSTSLQLDYHIMPSALGLNPSGLGVEVGFHL
jgi:hypothetical protein